MYVYTHIIIQSLIFIRILYSNLLCNKLSKFLGMSKVSIIHLSYLEL